MRFRPISVNVANIDYSAAVASAVAWLGNRYLLSTPARRLHEFEHHIDQPHRRVWPSAPTRPAKIHSA